ncbi:MAG: ATPase [Pseudomonadota bacterium]
MEDTLQRLLDAEMRAERIAAKADTDRGRIVQGAVMEARAEVQRFEEKIPEMQTAHLEKARARAEQTLVELKRRYDERQIQLRQLATEREDEAVGVAFALLIAPTADA